MPLLESPYFPDLVYLALMAGLWSLALALVSPGSGLLEGLALAFLAAAGLGSLALEVNTLALIPLALGAAFFGLSLRRRRQRLWLALSALGLSLGSAFLFEMEAGGPAVHPLLAILVSCVTLGFFWIAVRKAARAARARPAHDPQGLRGAWGEVRSDLDPVGTVYLEGELWSARAERRVPAGARVRVLAVEGLTLRVQADDPSREREET
jgi:membrane-bound serine protease (ClpP class)